MDSGPTIMDSAPIITDSVPIIMDLGPTIMDLDPTTMDLDPTIMDSVLDLILIHAEMAAQDATMDLDPVLVAASIMDSVMEMDLTTDMEVDRSLVLMTEKLKRSQRTKAQLISLNAVTQPTVTILPFSMPTHCYQTTVSVLIPIVNNHS